MTKVENPKTFHVTLQKSNKVTVEEADQMEENVLYVCNNICLLKRHIIDFKNFTYYLFPTDYDMISYYFISLEYDEDNDIKTTKRVPYVKQESNIIISNPLEKRWVMEQARDEKYCYIEVFIPKEKQNEAFDINMHSWVLLDSPIVLQDNSLLLKEYGKYKPNLTIIIPPTETLEWINEDKFNLGLKYSLSYVQGTFFKSKKGTSCFKISKTGEHYLLKDDWGGAFNGYHGETLPDNLIYYRRATSNGGGCGFDYAVVPIDYRNELTIDDI